MKSKLVVMLIVLTILSFSLVSACTTDDDCDS